MRFHFVLLQITIAAGVLTTLLKQLEEVHLMYMTAFMYVTVVIISFWIKENQKKLNRLNESEDQK
ncbi:hypothetical protein AN960_21170 [Bacillus sp. FJAT-25509]|uniref:hypothetical protein n=1 Tax=Bacillaceae TaxID=186817 RepID=UPI0006FE9E0E|nr:hypothetical protein [Bacillus sp. FJAT-25509]KQL33582.1 hypothetical protein AN960_21170 [Bacillus sp. FJAT-25509]